MSSGKIATTPEAASTSAAVNTAPPLLWWEVVARVDSAPDRLPFLDYFMSLGGSDGEEESMSKFKHRVATPVQAWEAFQARRLWGDDSGLIEEWFSAGEELQHSELELTIEEPDRWERALQWMRSLAVATGLRPT